MVELLKDFPPYVAAYKASGIVNSEEYERIVMPRMDQVAEHFGAINFIVRLETGMENYTAAALIDYLKISFKHIHRWNRMAIVSDQKTVRYFYDALSPLVPGKIIGFELKDYQKAKEWVSQPELVDENVFRWPWKNAMRAGVIATGAMTVFSYAVSKATKKNFNEPTLLGDLIQGWAPHVPAQPLGWAGHFGIGSIWSMVYIGLLSTKKKWASPAKFWVFSGATAIFFWDKLFKNNPNPPRINRKQFYAQLFFAHLVFTSTLQAAYSHLNREKF